MDSKRTRVSIINSLPDSVICHILSFLPTEESVRTRVLSTRWKHLFSVVPVLDFEYDYPSTNSIPIPYSASFRCISNNLIGTPAHTRSAPSVIIKGLLDFVDWIFNSYKANPMNKFRFKCNQRFKEASRLLSWVSESVCLGVRELDVSMFFKVPQTLPCGVFNCETLTDLNISGNFVLNFPNCPCLPLVKNIRLFHVSFVDGASAGRLFRSCPVLENLVICLSHTGDIQIIELFVPSLKSLLVIQSYNDNYVLVLNTAILEYLEYMGHVPHGVYANQGLKSLAKAFIGFPAHFRNKYDSLEKLFSELCHVRVLRICTWTLESLRRSGRTLPVFHNLIQLEIKVVSSFDWGFIVHLLFVMPNLEVLVVDNDGFVNENSHLFPEDVPSCVSLHLKEVKFIEFFMMEHEYKLVEYFLKNAEILETLKIESVDSVEHQLEMSVVLLTFPRYSRACQIVLT